MGNDIIKYSIEEIAEKILADSKYENNLKNGIEQKLKITGEYHYFVLKKCYYSEKVEKGDVLGYLTKDIERYREDDKDIFATDSGHFDYDDSIFYEHKYNYKTYLVLSNFFNGSEILIGEIYLPEFSFYKKNEKAIDEYVKNKKFQIEEQLRLVEIKKLEIEEADRRKAEKQLKEQNDAIEDIAELLKELDKYVLAKQTIEIETLSEISSALEILYNQKDNIQNIVSIKNSASYFESTYKEAKKNPNLTDIIENRMLTILRRFFEVLGESKDSVNTKILQIKSSENDKRFSVEFIEELKALDEAITKLQSTFTNVNKLDFEQLKIIENISVSFVKQKDRITQKKSLERRKEAVESIWKEYAKLDKKSSSAEENLKRILKNLYEVLGKSEQAIKEIFAKQDTAEAERKFAIEYDGISKKISSALAQLQNSIANKADINFSDTQIIENELSTLKIKKNNIKSFENLKNYKSKIEMMYNELRSQERLSDVVSKSLLKLLDMFYEILGKSEEQRKLIFAEMKKTDQEKRISARISKAMAALDGAMVQFQTALSNGETSDIAKLQEIAEIISILLKYKENIKDKKFVEKHKDNFVAMLNDCKNNADFSSSLETRILKILDMFYEILGKSEEQRKSIFAEMKKADQEKKIFAKITEAMTALDGAMVQFQTALSNGETLNIAKLQEIAGTLEVLLNLKDKFSSVSAIERYKTNFEVTFEECMKRDDFSQATETRMLQILDMFYNILGYSYDQKKQISDARAFSKMVNAQDKLMNKISETIRTLQISIEQRILPDISSLQVIEDALSVLKNHKDNLQDLTPLVQSSIYFSAMYKDCVKLGCLTSTKTRMKEISKSFDELLNKKSSVWEKIFRR